jgi:hypothetical protein
MPYILDVDWDECKFLQNKLQINYKGIALRET